MAPESQPNGTPSLADSLSETAIGSLRRVQEVLAVPTETRRWLRPVYFVLGLAFLGLGIAGVFLPLVPTTGPLLLAAWLLARSSTRVHEWLVHHPRFGRFITDFHSGRGIPLRTKVVATIAMTAAFGYSIGWVVPHPVGKGIVAAIAVWAIWYVLHQPTAE